MKIQDLPLIHVAMWQLAKMKQVYFRPKVSEVGLIIIDANFVYFFWFVGLGIKY